MNKRENILSQYLLWHFIDSPRAILMAWKNFLLFNLNYFSLSLLIKTFFSYWHKYRWYYPKSFSFGKILEVFFSNLISRIMGAILRFFLIIIGLLAESLIFFIGLIVLLIWFLLPAFLAIGFTIGFFLII